MTKTIAKELWGFAKEEAKLVKREFNMYFLLGYVFGIGLLVGGYFFLTRDTEEAREMRKPNCEFSEISKISYEKTGFFITQMPK